MYKLNKLTNRKVPYEKWDAEHCILVQKKICIFGKLEVQWRHTDHICHVKRTDEARPPKFLLPSPPEVYGDCNVGKLEMRWHRSHMMVDWLTVKPRPRPPPQRIHPHQRLYLSVISVKSRGPMAGTTCFQPYLSKQSILIRSFLCCLFSNDHLHDFAKIILCRNLPILGPDASQTFALSNNSRIH